MESAIDMLRKIGPNECPPRAKGGGWNLHIMCSIDVTIDRWAGTIKNFLSPRENELQIILDQPEREEERSFAKKTWRTFKTLIRVFHEESCYLKNFYESNESFHRLVAFNIVITRERCDGRIFHLSTIFVCSLWLSFDQKFRRQSPFSKFAIRDYDFTIKKKGGKDTIHYTFVFIWNYG